MKATGGAPRVEPKSMISREVRIDVHPSDLGCLMLAKWWFPARHGGTPLDGLDFIGNPTKMDDETTINVRCFEFSASTCRQGPKPQVPPYAAVRRF